MNIIKEIPNFKFHGLELQAYYYKTNSEFRNIKVTEYIPKLFKFRALSALKNEVSIFKIIE
jgi:hypothetical protein